MNLLHIIQNWHSSSDEDCDKIKNEIYKIIPEWINEKLHCVIALDNNYVFYKNDYGDDYCVLFNIENNTFIKSDKHWKDHFPENTIVIKTISTKSLFGENMLLIFFKYTGIYGVELIKNHALSEYSSSSCTVWFENNKVQEECIKYYENSTQHIYNVISNEIGTKKIHYSFDTGKLMDRYERWYDGEWKKMEELGILYDDHYEEHWDSNFVMHEYKFNTISCEKLIELFNGFKENNYYCNICNDEYTYSKIYHCLACINYEITNNKYISTYAYNECEKCYKENKKHEHELYLPCSNPEIFNKYMLRKQEMLDWTSKYEEECKNTKEIIENDKQNKIDILKNIIIDNPDNSKIIDFLENNNNFLILPNTYLIFYITSIFKSCYLFTDYEAYKIFYKKNKTMFIFNEYVLCLLGFSIEESSSVVNDFNKTKNKIISTTEYIPSAIDLYHAVTTSNKEYDNSTIYVLMISFIHTGIHGLALKIYDTKDKNKIYTGSFLFVTKQDLIDCRKYVSDLINFDYNGNDITRDDLELLLKTNTNYDLLNNRKKLWYDGEWKNPDFSKSSLINFTPIEQFMKEVGFIKTNKKIEHLTLCY